MKKKILLVVLALAVMMNTGCGAADSQSTGNEEERVPIRWLTTGDAAAEAIQADDRIVEAINERLGIELTVEIVPQGNTEKVNVAMASGDFPDVVTGAFGTSATQQWMDDGMVIALNDYIDNNENIKKWLDEYSWTASNGNYYGIPFITQYDATNTLIFMREDWLNNLGLTYPETLEEMKDVLTAFTFDDPDGNGVQDTYGFTAEKISDASMTPFDWVFFANGLEYADYTLDENGDVIPWFEDESFVPSMKYIKELWDAGVIDPELMLNDNSKMEEKFYQGKSGSMKAAGFRHVSRHESSLRELFPDASICYGSAPKGETGTYGLARQGKSGMFTCITAACKNPDKAAEFIDFMISEEGNNLLRLGIEGVHYTMNGEEIVFNEEERMKDAFSANGWAHALAWGSFYWPLEANYVPETDPDKERAQAAVVLATDSQVKNLIGQKTAAEIDKASVVDTIFVEYLTDMLNGKIDIEEGVKQLSADWREQGGNEILKAVNEYYRANQ